MRPSLILFSSALLALGLSPTPAVASFAVDSNGAPLTIGAGGNLGLTVNTDGIIDFSNNTVRNVGTLNSSTISANNGTITTFNSTTGTIATLSAPSATIGTLNATSGSVQNMSSTTGNISNLNATTAVVGNTLKVSGATSVGGNLTVSGVSYAGAYFHASDLRLKRNVRPVEGALEKVARLDGVSFNWKSDGRRDYGVTAQNVASVFPDMVTKGSNGTMLVSYDSLIGPMIEAIKELKKDNEALRNEVRALREQRQ